MFYYESRLMKDIVLDFSAKFLGTLDGTEVVKVVASVVYSRSVIYAATLVLWCLR